MSLVDKDIADRMYGVDRKGRKIDVLLEEISTKERWYLYCVIGDTKGHTGAGTLNFKKGSMDVNGHGIYQTGISVTDSSKVFINTVDCSIVEFLGDVPLTNLKNYRLLEIVVY